MCGRKGSSALLTLLRLQLAITGNVLGVIGATPTESECPLRRRHFHATTVWFWPPGVSGPPKEGKLAFG